MMHDQRSSAQHRPSSPANSGPGLQPASAAPAVPLPATLRRRLRGVREEAKAYAGAPEGEEEVAWDGGLERIEWALEDAIEVVDREAPGTDAPGDARLS